MVAVAGKQLPVPGQRRPVAGHKRTPSMDGKGGELPPLTVKQAPCRDHSAVWPRPDGTKAVWVAQAYPSSGSSLKSPKAITKEEGYSSQTRETTRARAMRVASLACPSSRLRAWHPSRTSRPSSNAASSTGRLPSTVWQRTQSGRLLLTMPIPTASPSRFANA